jgi:hypothetical protein
MTAKSDKKCPQKTGHISYSIVLFGQYFAAVILKNPYMKSIKKIIFYGNLFFSKEALKPLR